MVGEPKEPKQMNYNIKNTGHARLFKNPILEFLTQTSPFVTLMTYLPVIGGLLVVNYLNEIVMNPYTFLGLFLGAILSWTLFEYLMHRYLFHFITDSPAVQRFHYLMHGLHHEHPRDKERLFLPPVPGLTVAGIMFGVFYFLMGNLVFVFLPGFTVGYLSYAYIHYFMHTVSPPRVLKPLWKHHSLHHYKYNDKAYGVSSPIWDHVFGTMPPHK